ncbi:hypothetical protein LCGC14_3029770 [marine sediment metagenome]|uniref:Uncharacterized protein n=1 Tax=marine sediment metagenome TaxID=412755 RepID=A0A0F8ZIY2_9ZZZZ
MKRRSFFARCFAGAAAVVMWPFAGKVAPIAVADEKDCLIAVESGSWCWSLWEESNVAYKVVTRKELNRIVAATKRHRLRGPKGIYQGL